MTNRLSLSEFDAYIALGDSMSIKMSINLYPALDLGLDPNHANVGAASLASLKPKNHRPRTMVL